jgi:hypothetical protein
VASQDSGNRRRIKNSCLQSTCDALQADLVHNGI